MIVHMVHIEDPANTKERVVYSVASILRMHKYRILGNFRELVGRGENVRGMVVWYA